MRHCARRKDALMDLDPTYLTLSLLFGMVGMTLFLYGKKSSRIPHLAAGLALMTCPYFFTNVIVMTAICLVLAIAPFMMPEA
ncbi:MAG: hypothetical protein ABIP55_02490 [Tepidisphaeraceae bacterium]